MKAFLLMAGLAALAACGSNDRRVAFGGHYYDADTSVPRDDWADITVTVRPVSKGLDGAREAGRFEATRYCIRWFGNSEVDWQVGPDSDPAALPVANDTLTLRGRCVG